MRRLAIVSDVHADLEALRQALAQARRLGCDLIVCAGDLVDGGSFPEETLALLEEQRIPCVRGNHDRWALQSEPPGRDQDGNQLSPRALAFLAGLPTGWEAELDGGRVVVRHASSDSDMNRIYPDRTIAAVVERHLGATHADVLLVGHTHVPCAIHASGNRLVANPGALARIEQRALLILDGPEDLPPIEHGTFGVLDVGPRRFTVHRAADGSEVEIARVWR